jgi:hypothetical protein
MKQLRLGILFLMASLFSFSLMVHGQSKLDKWPELKTFHGVMSQTFHPSEEGNLEPIKKRISEMVTKAEALAKSKIPNEFSNKDVKTAVAKLAADSKKLMDLINSKAGDDAIKIALSELHDTFHVIVEKCSSSEKHE